MTSNSLNKEMDAVVQRNIIRNKSDKRYCPATVYKANSIKYHVKFRDGETGLYNKSQLYLNDPNDIDESQLYWEQMKIIFEKGNKILANVKYDTIVPDYQYGIISSYNISTNSCTIDFDNYGQLSDIPTEYIMTPMDNRFISGIRNISNNLEEDIDEKNYVEEEYNIDYNIYKADKYCDPIQNINNDYSDEDIEKMEKKAKKIAELRQKEFNSMFIKARRVLWNIFIFISVISAVYMIKLLFMDKINESFFDVKLPFPCIEFKNITKSLWVVFMMPIIAPLYIIYYCLCEFFHAFEFSNYKFDISGYLSASIIPLDNMGVSHKIALLIYIFLIVFFSIGYVTTMIMDMKDNLYSSKTKAKEKEEAKKK